VERARTRTWRAVDRQFAGHCLRDSATTSSAGRSREGIEPLRATDLPLLFDLYRDVLAFPPAESLGDYWRWRYDENPFNQDADPLFWVTKHDGKIVGALGQMPLVLEVDGTSLQVYWAADFMVAPAFRGRGLGTSLFRHARQVSDVVVSMGYPQGSATSRTARAAGFHPFPRRPYLFKLYSLRPVTERLPIPSAMTRKLAKLVAPFLQTLGTHPRLHGSLTLRAISRFDRTFDHLWERVRPRTGVVFQRSHETMNWRYLSTPFFRYHMVEAWRSGGLAGCLVLKITSTAGLIYATIPELITAVDDAAAQESLLAWALARCEATGVDVVKTLVSSPSLEQLLRRSGFRALGKGSDFVLSLAPGREPPCSPTLLRHDMWHVTKGDGDLDMVPDFAAVSRRVGPTPR
jgi:GNAT superfamily N-acetyltransferase